MFRDRGILLAIVLEQLEGCGLQFRNSGVPCLWRLLCHFCKGAVWSCDVTTTQEAAGYLRSLPGLTKAQRFPVCMHECAPSHTRNACFCKSARNLVMSYFASRHDGAFLLPWWFAEATCHTFLQPNVNVLALVPFPHSPRLNAESMPCSKHVSPRCYL